MLSGPCLLLSSLPHRPHQWPSPWCSPSRGCLLFMGPPLPSALPAAPPLQVVPGSWQVCCPLGGPPFPSAAPPGRSICSKGSRQPLTCFCFGSSPLESILCFLGPSPTVPQTPNGSFILASPCPHLISHAAPLPGYVLNPRTACVPEPHVSQCDPVRARCSTAWAQHPPHSGKRVSRLLYVA